MGCFQNIIVHLKMKINYDKRFDTLYVALGDKSNSYGDDSMGSVIIMRDLDTDEITGITILSFLKKYHAHSLPELPPQLGISFENDILPAISI